MVFIILLLLLFDFQLPKYHIVLMTQNNVSFFSLMVLCVDWAHWGQLPRRVLHVLPISWQLGWNFWRLAWYGHLIWFLLDIHICCTSSTVTRIACSSQSSLTPLDCSTWQLDLFAMWQSQVHGLLKWRMVTLEIRSLRPE